MKDKLLNKKVIIPIIVVIVIIAIICGGYFLTLHILKTSAIKEVDTVFNAIKLGDEETIKQYLDGTETEYEDEEDLDTNDSSEEMAKIMLSNMNYEIISTDVSLKECTVKLNISNKDLKTVFGNYMQKAFSLAFSQAFGQITEEEMNTQMQQYFEEQYNSDEIETITSELIITMTIKNGKWIMDADKDQVINSILPGYEEIMESIDNMQ